jgi:hypothetical protein
LGSTYPP